MRDVFTVNFGQHHVRAQLLLKPLFFEVPLIENDFLFVGRQWLLQKLESVVLNDASSGVLIFGRPGTGKTAAILQLVENSCFGRKRNRMLPNDKLTEPQNCDDAESAAEPPKICNLQDNHEIVSLVILANIFAKSILPVLSLLQQLAIQIFQNFHRA